MVSVIIPIYNDPNIKESITELQHILPIDHEIILVDDGSKLNGSVFYGNKVWFLSKPFNEGKGAAIKTGLKYAKGEYIAIMDADLQIDPDDLTTFFNIMELYGADAVIGNKRHPYSVVHYSPLRWVVSNSYNALCRLLFGIQLRDTQTGLKLFRREALKKVMDKVMVKRFAFDIELIIALRDNSFRVADAPVFVKQTIGKGSVSMGSITQTLIDTLAVFYRRSLGWYRLS